MQKQTGTIQVKRTFPEMLKGGVICDVVNAEQVTSRTPLPSSPRFGPPTTTTTATSDAW